MQSKKIFITLLSIALLALVPCALGRTFIVHCPAAGDLTKDPVKLTWSANHHNFRSYDMSFATSIEKFLGAQWVGETVGQTTCVYKALPERSFPVLLVFRTIALEPHGGAWTKNLGGYRDCNSSHTRQCLFTVRLKKKTQHIYEEARRLKLERR